MADLLEYGRPPQFTWRTQLINDVVEHAARACEAEASGRHVQVVKTTSGDALVLMDAQRLERVFINLIQNAIQHAPTGTTVRVEVTAASAPPTQAAVTVRDAGPGIAPEDLPRIFEPFFSRRLGGFGLGLAISERIVNEHQGTIAAANDPAGGVVMTVWLPATADTRGEKKTSC